MKSNRTAVVLLFVGLVVGFVLGGGAIERSASGQGGTAPPVPRFQISAWGFPSAAGTQAARGCYIVDTTTGELWHSILDNKPQKIR